MICRSRAHQMMPWLMRTSGTVKESQMISKQLHHSALSVISLLRADGPSNMALFCCSSSPIIQHAHTHTKTHTSVSRYKRSRSDGIFQILFLSAAHKQTRFHRQKLKHSVTFQNKSACQRSVFVWQISLDMQHFQSYLKPEIPFHFLTV